MQIVGGVRRAAREAPSVGGRQAQADEEARVARRRGQVAAQDRVALEAALDFAGRTEAAHLHEGAQQARVFALVGTVECVERRHPLGPQRRDEGQPELAGATVGAVRGRDAEPVENRHAVAGSVGLAHQGREPREVASADAVEEVEEAARIPEGRTRAAVRVLVDLFLREIPAAGDGDHPDGGTFRARGVALALHLHVHVFGADHVATIHRLGRSGGWARARQSPPTLVAIAATLPGALPRQRRWQRTGRCPYRKPTPAGALWLWRVPRPRRSVGERASRRAVASSRAALRRRLRSLLHRGFHGGGSPGQR